MKKGFTLIEIIISIGLILLISVPFIFISLKPKKVDEEKFLKDLKTNAIVYLESNGGDVNVVKLKNDNKTMYIQIKDLIEQGLLDEDDIDPKNGNKKIADSRELYVKISKNDEGFYELLYPAEKIIPVLVVNNESDISDTCKFKTSMEIFNYAKTNYDYDGNNKFSLSELERFDSEEKNRLLFGENFKSFCPWTEPDFDIKDQDGESLSTDPEVTKTVTYDESQKKWRINYKTDYDEIIYEKNYYVSHNDNSSPIIVQELDEHMQMKSSITILVNITEKKSVYTDFADYITDGVKQYKIFDNVDNLSDLTISDEQKNEIKGNFALKKSGTIREYYKKEYVGKYSNNSNYLSSPYNLTYIKDSSSNTLQTKLYIKMNYYLKVTIYNRGTSSNPKKPTVAYDRNIAEYLWTLLECQDTTYSYGSRDQCKLCKDCYLEITNTKDSSSFKCYPSSSDDDYKCSYSLYSFGSAVLKIRVRIYSPYNKYYSLDSPSESYYHITLDYGTSYEPDPPFIEPEPDPPEPEEEPEYEDHDPCQGDPYCTW